MQDRNRIGLFGLLVALVVMVVTSAHADGEPATLSVTGAWIRAVPPVSQVTAGYMVVENHGDGERVLVDVRSPWFKGVMVHRSIMKNGMATMEHQDRLIIPAHGRVEFKPGGYHLMLFDPIHSLNLDETVPMVLVFEDGSEVTADVPVRQGDDEGHAHHH